MIQKPFSNEKKNIYFTFIFFFEEGFSLACFSCVLSKLVLEYNHSNTPVNVLVLCDVISLRKLLRRFFEQTSEATTMTTRCRPTMSPSLKYALLNNASLHRLFRMGESDYLDDNL